MSNEQMDSFDPFQMAKVEKDAMREARESGSKNNYGGRKYEEYEYLGLNPDEKKVFRIVSNPVKLNGESLTEKDARLVMTSRILTDEGKGFCNINWQWKIKNGKFTLDLRTLTADQKQQVQKIGKEKLLNIHASAIIGQNMDAIVRDFFNGKNMEYENYKRC